jgi:mono/diheme cytochrome c family protein
MIRTALCVLALGVTGQAQAGGYGYGYAQQKFVAPLVQQFYFVGAPIRAAAIVEAEKRSDPDYQEFLQFKALREEWGAFQAWQAQTVPEGALAQQQSAFKQSCVRCHSGDEPKGGLDLTQAPLSPATVKAIKERLTESLMPPRDSPEGKNFTPEQAGAIVSEAIDLLE